MLDADYVVHPNWLKDLVPVFADAKVGMIQAPQDHRDGERSAMHHAMNGEYAGFFDIGMVQRNEKNAIIAHGTMCLIRRSALVAAGNWSSDTICEDTDLGLTILELGFAAHYTNRRYGYGLLPDSYLAYKRQRDRWAYGGFQIMKKHWRRFLPGRSLLTREQKREFTLGWLSWLGAESVGVLVALLNLIWVPFVAIVGIAIPDKILTIPILAAFAVAVAAFRLALSAARPAFPAARCWGRCSPRWALQWTVARAVGYGLIKDGLPFVRTAKGGSGRRSARLPGVLGGGDRRAAGRQRDLPACHQLGARARDRSVCAGARDPVAAVPRLGRAGRARRQPRQRLRVLARPRSAAWPDADAPSGRRQRRRARHRSAEKQIEPAQ